MYEGKRSAITNVVTIERALWHYDNTFFFTNQLEVDFVITLVKMAMSSLYEKEYNQI